MINGLITDPQQWIDAMVAMGPHNKDDYHSPHRVHGELEAPETATLNPWVGRVKDVLQVLASITVLVASLWACVTFLTGGLKSQDQFAIADLSSRVAAMQSSLSTVSTQLSSMPRPSDYSGLVDHLRSLDLQNAALNDQLTQTRIDLARLSTQLGIVSTNPPNRGPAR